MSTWKFFWAPCCNISDTSSENSGEQSWRIGESTRLPPNCCPGSNPSVDAIYVGWVCCWFSPLLREVFLRVLRFSLLLKNQHFQIPIRSGTHGNVNVSTSSYDLLSAPLGNKCNKIYIYILEKNAALNISRTKISAAAPPRITLLSFKAKSAAARFRKTQCFTMHLIERAPNSSKIRTWEGEK